ncbi:SDR family oxidoreductase [Pseudomonas sp. SWRI59]|uniref:dTDP-4-dehydrorhamnose reductase family protein n=1 Tax=Pseudomonas TaxID=286 RepID=UPI0016445780|nr:MULTISPECIES: SDR family oxidoreductase [unclassified Pseudomonas]MBC3482373.1 SDR family oxidoreductase [Pseudomonas sp. SWRI77]MBC3500299.1 SDR family oxidoreductase [Pseudomonas sp. SWRI59]MBC3505628.1 SDR family oxidoreductase [Pseudomonas sp. SWRI68]UVL05213.1 SDR family oxidoreductase [Pseudomonas sp. B21-047]
MNILVLGVSGMLGSAVFRYFSANSQHRVLGTLRSSSALRYFTPQQSECLLTGVDVLDADALMAAFAKARPDVVINCVGLIKQLADAKDPLTALPINAMLPHRLATLCRVAGARLIHVSTDCVFSGTKGMYREQDESDCTDLYGKSKFIGELHDLDDAVTLRTSIIGHELQSNASLVDWFLSQQGSVKGFNKAIFSGLPTAELARVMLEYVIPNPTLKGLYHVSAEPIDKYELLKQVAQVYGKDIQIVPDDKLVIDRSLDSSRFRADAGYQPPTWPALIEFMHAQRQ